MSIENYRKNSALCAQNDPDLFFPPDGRVGEREARQAKAICLQCTAREKCLEYAVSDASLIGIWGGTNVAERRKIRRLRRELGELTLNDIFAEFDKEELDEQIA